MAKIKTLISGSPVHLLVIFNSKENDFTSLAGSHDLTCLAVCFKPTGYTFRFLVIFKGPACFISFDMANRYLIVQSIISPFNSSKNRDFPVLFLTLILSLDQLTTIR